MQGQDDAAVILGGIRARGSRLDPGEVEEIEHLVQRGQLPNLDQVLGLVETIRALQRRCAMRFAETLDLRDQVTDLRVELEQASVSDQAAELNDLRHRFGQALEMLASVRLEIMDVAMVDVLDGIRDGAASPEASSHFMANRLNDLRNILARGAD